MDTAIADILGPAVGVAISPIPIIAVILMLFTPKAKVNSVAFLVGWVAGMVIVGAIVLASGLAESGSGGPSTTSGWIKLGLGVLLLALAARNWRTRPAPGETAEMPKWMAQIDGFTPPKSAAMAAALSGVNPKNLALTAAAAATIGASGISTGEQYATLAVFVGLASVTVAVPVVFYLVMGPKADATLTSWKEWLGANNATVMMVLFAVFGAKLIGDGWAIVG